MIRQIVISGEGGQGVKVLTHVLGNILVHLGYYVTVEYDYDADVRGGKIVGYLVYSDKKIRNPMIEEADILLKLSEKGGEFNAHYTICEKGLKHGKKSEEIPFGKIASKKFGSRMVINMVALGRLLRKIGIDLKKVDLEKELPHQFIEKNIDAIKYGYTFRDELH